MPSLSERISDVPLIAGAFLERYASRMKRPITGFDDAATQALQRYHWPGNVRELENTVERAVVLCKGTAIGVQDLPEKIINRGASDDSTPFPFTTMPLDQALEGPERRILESALRANQGNRQLTAAQLEINRTTLYKKMKKYGLDAQFSAH
jgi:DNA-binding NtrC family response regulator